MCELCTSKAINALRALCDMIHVCTKVSIWPASPFEGWWWCHRIHQYSITVDGDINASVKDVHVGIRIVHKLPKLVHSVALDYQILHHTDKTLNNIIFRTKIDLLALV